MPEHKIESVHSIEMTRGQWLRVLSWAGSGEALAGEINRQLENEEGDREPLAEGRDHLTATGLFRSDKYPWSRDGFVPLKVTDEMAWPMLRAYAAARVGKDLEFTRDLDEALDKVGAPSMSDFLAQGEEEDAGGSPRAIADMMQALSTVYDGLSADAEIHGNPQLFRDRRDEIRNEMLRLSKKVE